MALVIRGGRTYWYKSVRKGGRVTSEYRGGGEFAAPAGRLEAIEHEKRRTRARDDKARRARLEAEDRPILEMFRAVEIVARAFLESRGYYLHRRHEWRRRGTVSATTKPAAAALDAPLPPPEISTDELFKRARKGDKAVLPRLQAWLDRDPGAFRGVAEMTEEAEYSLAAAASGGTTPDNRGKGSRALKHAGPSCITPDLVAKPHLEIAADGPAGAILPQPRLPCTGPGRTRQHPRP